MTEGKTDASGTEAMEKLSLAALYKLQGTAAEHLVRAKAQVAEVAGELGRRFAASAKQALDQAGKSHGTTSLPLQDGFIAKADVKQTVTYDTAKLMAVARTMPWERVEAIFKITFAVAETIYKGIGAGNPELKKKIDEARTVKLSEPKIVLVKEGE